MSSFRWNGGGTYKDKEWSPELGPTDTQIIIHLFCTFMDTQLPDYQNTGRPFTGVHFVVTPDTPSLFIPLPHLTIRCCEEWSSSLSEAHTTSSFPSSFRRCNE